MIRVVPYPVPYCTVQRTAVSVRYGVRYGGGQYGTERGTVRGCVATKSTPFHNVLHYCNSTARSMVRAAIRYVSRSLERVNPLVQRRHMRADYDQQVRSLAGKLHIRSEVHRFPAVCTTRLRHRRQPCVPADHRGPYGSAEPRRLRPSMCLKVCDEESTRHSTFFMCL